MAGLHDAGRASAAFLTAAACLSGEPRASGANAPLEYEVKAAFLFRFAQFVEWPADTFKQSSEPFTYCTIGEDPFHGALEQTLNGKTIGQRPLRVEHLSGAGKVDECQVLASWAWSGRSASIRCRKLLKRRTGALPILTVGETDRFAGERRRDWFPYRWTSKIRFEVNLDAAGKAGLKISAKLLALAKTVLGAPKGT